MDTAAPAKKVECKIRLGTLTTEYHCNAASMDELKNRALALHRKSRKVTDYDDAVMVCREDGLEMMDMTMLDEHVQKGHTMFYLVGPKLKAYERALNVTRVSKLYAVLTDVGMKSDKENYQAAEEKIREKIKLWAHDPKRLDDLHVIVNAQSKKVARKLGIDPMRVPFVMQDIQSALYKYDPKTKARFDRYFASLRDDPDSD